MSIYMLKEDSYHFPSIGQNTQEGVIAIGGDLSPERLLSAYSSGIFPWGNEDGRILWWSINPRMVMKPTEMKVTKSLWKTIESNKYSCSFDTEFEDVIRKCTVSDGGDNEDDDNVDDSGDTLIDEDMTHAYCELHELGFAHSVETYFGNKLVGGLYGVSIGKMFCVEAMFSTKTDASKVAFYNLCEFLRYNGFELVDLQEDTSVTKRLGGYPMPRKEFQKKLKNMIKNESLVGNWGDDSAEWKKLVIE